MAWFVGLFSGLGRWADPDTWKALGFAAAAVVVMGGLLYLHHDNKVERKAAIDNAAKVATAQCDARWVQQQIADSTAALNRSLNQERAARDAADLARSQADGERNAAVERAAALETTLAAMKDNPVVWPRDVARSLRK